MKTYKLSYNDFWWDQWQIMFEAYPEVFNIDMKDSDQFRTIKRNKRWIYVEMSDRAKEIIKEYAEYIASWINYPDMEEHNFYRQCATIARQLS